MAGVIRKGTLRHPRHAQRTTGHALGHAAQDVRLAGDVRYAPNMSALAVNVTRAGFGRTSSSSSGTWPPSVRISWRSSGARRHGTWRRDSRTAQAAYAAAPTDAAALTAWREAHYLLQELNAAAAHAAANRAGLAWQQYGEQSTYWFHHVARERQAQTSIAALRTGVAPDSPVVQLQSANAREEGLRVLEEFYSGDSPSGLFSARPVTLAAQDSLLAAIDQQLTPEAAAAGEGDLGDGSLTLGELASALKGLPRGKAPGRDGIPYEFYRRFWDQVGDYLLAALQEAFSGGSPALPHSTLQGRITLLYKGKGADRAAPASYRPITLLNTGLQARSPCHSQQDGPSAQPGRGRHADSLPARSLDRGQRAGPPGGDRVPGAHAAAGHHAVPGLREGLRPPRQALDRAVHGGSGLRARAAALGASSALRHHSLRCHEWLAHPVIPCQLGRFLQGSPLSPLLYALACQPLAAHVRQRARDGAFQQIRLPSGRPAPAMQQHADDTSIYVPSPEDARVVLDGSVELHCQATSAKLQRAKSQGLALGSAAPIEGVEPVTGISFSVDAAGITHLGIPLSRDEGAAQQALYLRILESVRTRIRRWAGHGHGLHRQADPSWAARHQGLHRQADPHGAVRLPRHLHPHAARHPLGCRCAQPSTSPATGAWRRTALWTQPLCNTRPSWLSPCGTAGASAIPSRHIFQAILA